MELDTCTIKQLKVNLTPTFVSYFDRNKVGNRETITLSLYRSEKLQQKRVVHISLS